MVSADNVNYDVLTLIFAFLGANDLVSVCLVSQSFRAGAIPWLYKKIQFRLSHMKRWPLLQSPFTTILENPKLGVHLRSCDIKSVPRLKDRPHPRFISSCVESLSLCPNLTSFTCTASVSPFLSILSTKTRLADLKLYASALNTDQSRILSKVNGLHSLSLYEASLNICQALPRWIPTMHGTLTSITITNSRDLNQTVLNAIVPPSSRLRGLHIIGCAKVSDQAMLRLIPRTPLLESLSLTIWEYPGPTTPRYESALPLPYIRHISIDIRCTVYVSPQPDAVPLFLKMLTPFEACPLKSLTLRFSERTHLPDSFICLVIKHYSSMLVRFNALNATIGSEIMDGLMQHCIRLEQLAVVLPTEPGEMELFTAAMRSGWALDTLIDVGDSHSAHGRKGALQGSHVWGLFRSSGYLKKIISGNRCWTVRACGCFRRFDYPNSFAYPIPVRAGTGFRE
ncbi:hypothetical protein BU17DRAFT_48405 [Hysterangium stoloniferum]|nr:hypothetical protein BU17DRAFT_48405 [Hysterangium stoloniferum]